MIIVLIWWRIKPTDEAEAEFKERWRQELKIDDKSCLLGEFLSMPVAADELKFLSQDFLDIYGDYRTFVNVGIWRDLSSFEQQVGKYFDDNQPPLGFEALHRRRTILKPEVVRLGNWQINAESFGGIPVVG